MKKTTRVISSILLLMILFYTLPIYAYANNKTIYTKLNSDGKVYKEIISTKENEEVNQKESDEKLPLETIISFKLNDKAIKADELVGKSGKVTIKIQYINKSSKEVYINGVKDTMYTPFIVAVGSIIDNSNNKNINVTHGKLIENGDKSIVVAMLMPGLRDSLDLSNEFSDIDIPDSVEITMDSTNFEMNNIMSYSTPKVLDDKINWSNFDNLFSDVNRLSDASIQIEDGSKQLVNGIEKLKDGASKLSEGANKIDLGEKQLADSLNNEISKYKSIEEKIKDRKALKLQITNIINKKIQEIMPSIEAQAEREAINVVSNHNQELQSAVVNTALKYTNAALDSKLQQAKDGSLITPEQEKQIFDSLSKDIENVLRSIGNDPQSMQLIAAIKTGIINQVKSDVGTVTKSAVNNVIENSKKSINKDAFIANLTPEQKSQIQQIVSAMVPGFVMQYTAQGMDAQTATERATNIAMQYAYSLVGIGAEDGASLVLNTLSNENTLNAISNNVVDSIITKIESGDDKAIEEALNEYKKSVAAQIANTIKTSDKQIINQVQEQMKDKMIDLVKQELGNDKLLKEYKTQIENELNSTIQSLSEKTAVDVAAQYTEVLANEIASNMIKTQLYSALNTNELDSTIDTYLNQLYSKLDEVDGKINYLQDGLYKLTNGTNSLKNGTAQLEKGVYELYDGAGKLAQGITTFNKEGISKISNFVNGDLYNTYLRCQKLEELSNDYNTFGADEKNDSIKFISIVDGIKISEQDNDNNEAIIKED